MTTGGQLLPALTRRQVLAGSAAGALALALSRLQAAAGGAPGRGAPALAGAPLPDYRGWEDVYRAEWAWDRVVRGTHLRANCFSACSLDLYVKDGVVWREEQADVYARRAPGLPDYAPRGCQKGCHYAALSVAPDRVRYPLERVGPRGSGRWRRISWEEALGQVADAVVDAACDGGAETVVYDNGTSNVDNGPSTVGEMRLFGLLGATMLDGFAGTGDLAKGALQTWGTSFVDGTSDDWFRADTLFLWHCNPVATRIPDAHFVTEARYHGTTVVTVSPDLSPSAIHASLWVNARLGTDAALALGLAREILARAAVDEDYVREQTDLPFLVRDDSGRFLRQSDLAAGGRDDIFYVWDLHTGRAVEAPATAGKWSDSLALGGIVPALAGDWRLRLPPGVAQPGEASHRPRPAGGTDAAAGGPSFTTVRPVMELLRQRLRAYDVDTVADITGVGPATQARLADLLVRSRRTLFYASWGSCKAYHSDLLQRALILLSALRGQHGRTGAGVRFASWLGFEGGDELLGARPSWLQRQVLRFYTPPPRAMEDAIAEASRTRLAWTPSHLFLHVHAGLAEVQDDEPRDAGLPRPAAVYFREAVERGWLRPRPAADNPPRVYLFSGVNPLRRWPLPQVVRRVLWPKLRLIVALDTRLSSSALEADIVLPAAGYYEKRGIKYAVALTPYVVVGDRAVPPLGDAKPEWEVMALLAGAVAERARARGVDALADLDERFSAGGRWGAGDDEAVLDAILRGSSVTGGRGWDEMRRLGAVRAASTGGWGVTSGIGSEIEPQGSLSPSRVHVQGQHAWPTLTGRQQFYLDHPWFLEADEALPCWKPPPGRSAAHPILLTGGHTRWSIHAIWRADPTLLRLQRGEPSMWMSMEDAQARGIRDHAPVRVSNRHGWFRVRARLSPAIAPGEAVLYHAWEPFQFPGWRGPMEVVASPYKPLHLAGGYGHLRERAFASGPQHVPRAVPVQIEPV